MGDILALLMMTWLTRFHLTTPTWIVLKSLQPYRWLLGQAALVGAPLATLGGVGQAWNELLTILDDPDRYNDLCAALDPTTEFPG